MSEPTVLRIWIGNRIDAETTIPVAETADQFLASRPHPDASIERQLRLWMTDPDGLNASWDPNDQAFYTLLSIVVRRWEELS